MHCMQGLRVGREKLINLIKVSDFELNYILMQGMPQVLRHPHPLVRAPIQGKPIMPPMPPIMPASEKFFINIERRKYQSLQTSHATHAAVHHSWVSHATHHPWIAPLIPLCFNDINFSALIYFFRFLGQSYSQKAQKQQSSCEFNPLIDINPPALARLLTFHL